MNLPAAMATPAELPAPGRRAVFVSSEVFREPAFGRHHPLSIQRMARVVDCCEALGWLDGAERAECAPAAVEELTRFHTPAYVEALREADESGRVPRAVRERYRIGTMENPLFPGVFVRAAATVGGAILAARLVRDGGVAYHPAGGTHHGRPDRASGFCYFNDPVFAVRTLLDDGCARVAYVDLDAHHGDGVQEVFAADPRVATVSIHEAGRWPHTGAEDDVGGGRSVNLPVPPGFSDAELAVLMDETVAPVLDDFRPGAVVITCGADGLAGDPLSGMRLGNVALWDAVVRLAEMTSRTVVLGGGGYNPWTVVRCWAGLWGRLRGLEPPAPLPPAVRELLAGFECDLVDEEDVRPAWRTTLADARDTAPARREVIELGRRRRRAWRDMNGRCA